MNFIANIIRQSMARNAGPNGMSVSQAVTTFLQPVVPTLSLTSAFHIRGKVRRRCKDCWMQVIDGRMYNFCKTHPRHKQMGLQTHEKKKRILTWAGMSKVRPW